MANMFALCLAILLAVAFSDPPKYHVSRSMRSYALDCGTKSPLHIAPGAVALLQHHNVPGAGIDRFRAFETVLKDGFMQAACVKDYMYYMGDKFGTNKHDYKLGPISNVSIVHYETFVAKGDQVKMTQKACFEFCRTIPNMGFFGIVNGRNCYCTPYFTPMESDSSQCDELCEGDPTLVCGGKSKSSVFSLHMCDSTKDDLGAASEEASSEKADLDSNVDRASYLAKRMQSMGQELEKIFGAVGDSSSTSLMQDAKGFAGKLLHTGEDGHAVAKKLGSLAEEASGLKGFTDPTTVGRAERIMEEVHQWEGAIKAISDELEGLIAAASPMRTTTGAAEQYYPVMYFVDKDFVGFPSTCNGQLVAEPIVDKSEDGCASACDAHIHSCVGYQYFVRPLKGGQESLCFLLGAFETGSYYTGCGKKTSFLQLGAPPLEAKCAAKLSKFQGTTLAPNPEGKCKQCFSELTKADRCYK